MAIKIPEHFVLCSKRFIFSESTKMYYRMSSIDFTRNRKLPFESLVLCMLKLLRRSLALELDNFFNSLGSKVKQITPSAFVQSRKKLNPDLFYDLNGLIVKEYYTDNDEGLKLYKGLRLLSVDGSTIGLPLNRELKKSFGVFNNQHKNDDVVIGRVSVLYDVLNNIVLDGLLRPFSQGEVSLSREHLKHTHKGDLIIMDRAYPSFHTAYLMRQIKVDFLFRCKHSFSNITQAFLDSGKLQQTLEIAPTQNRSFKDQPYTKDSRLTVRLLRITLDSGEVEILMTSLLNNKEYLYRDFKELYFKRWKVETFYDRFKNIIGVECFSGTSNQFIQQEFNCALYMSNMQSILTQDAQSQVDINNEKRKYRYKVNSSLSLGFIRDRLIKIYTTDEESENTLSQLKELFIVHTIPIRDGRKNKREKDKFRKRTKPKQFKNRRSLF